MVRTVADYYSGGRSKPKKVGERGQNVNEELMNLAIKLYEWKGREGQ